MLCSFSKWRTSCSHSQLPGQEQLIPFSFFNLPSEEELKIISLRHFPTLIHSLFSIPLPLSIPSTTFPFSFNSPPLHSPSLSIPLHYIHLPFQFPSTTFIFPFDSPPLHSSSLLLNKVFSYTICFVTRSNTLQYC